MTQDELRAEFTAWYYKHPFRIVGKLESDPFDYLLCLWQAAAEHREERIVKLTTIIEQIMTDHWDLSACPCAICVAGRAAGCRPRERYLPSHVTGTPPPPPQAPQSSPGTGADHERYE
jgi:hypothetical protein